MSQQRMLRVRKEGGGVVVVVFSQTSGTPSEAAGRVQAARQALEQSKGGVELDPVEFMQPIPCRGVAERVVTIRNVGEGGVRLHGVRLVRGNTGYSVSHDTLPMRISSGRCSQPLSPLTLAWRLWRG